MWLFLALPWVSVQFVIVVFPEHTHYFQLNIANIFDIESKKDGKDQDKRNKNTINITNKSQEVSPFPAGDQKAAMNRLESMRNTRHK